MPRARRLLLRMSLPPALLCGVAITMATPVRAAAQTQPVIEVSVPFDSAGRVPVITPVLVARLRLTAPVWPVTESFREARLFRTVGSDSAHVLVVQRVDGTVARYALSTDAVVAVRSAVREAFVAQGRSGERFIGTGTGLDVSQPAGNAFVRNQALLGIVAYGPGAAALLSKAGPAAAGGAYFMAAGASFFTAASIAKHQTVTRAQARRAAHGGTRGAFTGLGIAALADAEDGLGWGAAVLVGGIGGSIAGFHQARALSDGEAATAGLFADLGALGTAGIGGGLGAFETRKEVRQYDPNNPQYGTYTRSDNSLRGGGKATIAAAIGAQTLGYALGPRYARLAGYNVTAGDADMVLTSAVLGAAGMTALAGDASNSNLLWGAAAAGLVGGAILGDRGFVRSADRTAADGTLARLGAVAGALIGAGVGAIAQSEGRAAIGLATAGGVIGLLAADHLIAPARDAGPLRGVMQGASRNSESRFTLSIGPVTSARFTF